MALHAHPDDEALYTGGTLARCAAEGHRVVVVTATAGERGFAADTSELGDVRRRELEAATSILGVHRLELLGYGDSGSRADVPPPPGSLCATPVAEVAERVAAVLAEERPDVVTVYDANGGYGHRDHARVHEAGRLAARIAGTPVVLQATLPRETVQRAVRTLNALRVRPGGMTAAMTDGWYLPAAEITHEIDVGPWVEVKRRALAAHASQASGGGDIRTVRLLSRLPLPVARRVLGREWYAECGGSATSARSPHRQNDLFATVTER